MTAEDLPRDRKTSLASGPLASFRGIAAKFAYVARRKWMSWRLRFAIWRYSSADAEVYFASQLAAAANDSRQLSRLANAALRGARAAERPGGWLAASRLWTLYARASGDFHKAGRNLIRCARATTKGSYDEGHVADALQCWKLLESIEPNSVGAHQGVAWCHASLARFAEERQDWPAAKAHWQTILDTTPHDQAAHEGLQRTIDAEVAEAPHNAARVRALYDQLKRSTRREYSAECAAAQQLFDVGAPQLALEFTGRALAHRRETEALYLLFRCQLARSNFEEALAAFTEFAATGDVGAISAAELRTFVGNIAPLRLPRAVIANVARAIRYDARSQPALLPHLLVYRLHAEIAAAVDSAVVGSADWPEILVLETAQELIKAELREHALRLLARFSTHPNVAKAFVSVAETWPAEQLERSATAGAGTDSDAKSALAVAEYYAVKGNWSSAAHILAGFGIVGKRLFPTDNDRLGALVAQVVVAADPPTRQALAQFVGTQLSEAAREFFAGEEFTRLCDELRAAARFQKASASSRTGQFREHHFEHYVERRENQPLDRFATDFALCNGVLRYFSAMARFRHVENIPVSKELRARLAVPSLRLGERSADVLMTYAFLRDHPDCDLRAENLFEQIAGWHVSSFMPANHVPCACIGPDVLTHFNTVEHDHSAVGVFVTPFAKFLWTEFGEVTLRDDVENPLIALLTCLEAVPALSRRPQYRPFFSAMLPVSEEVSFADLCISLLSGKNELRFSELLNGTVEDVQQVQEHVDGVQQDVLVIGHGGEGTGLSRNFRMLTDALTADDIALVTLIYEMEPERFAEGLRQWHGACRSRPIVVAAVNAQDIPALFERDRYGIFEECHVVGFFLWETSQAPRVQQLGVQLVDEIWTPTRYVADVYARAAPTFVVGKGLFGPDGQPHRPLCDAGPMRFLTVFDFHSSIERKNPLASVLAFRQAFADGEDVELIIKASNVNPQHPGNAFGQWDRLVAEAVQDKRIKIIADRYSQEQMCALIAQADCVVSLHRSEGFGYVLADAMALGIPVIATAYSGNLDFCDAETSFPVDYRLVQVQALEAHWESEGAVWADPDLDSAAAQMRRVYEDYPLALRLAAAGQARILHKYSAAAFAANLQARIAAIRESESAIDRHARRSQ